LSVICGIGVNPCQCMSKYVSMRVQTRQYMSMRIKIHVIACQNMCQCESKYVSMPVKKRVDAIQNTCQFVSKYVSIGIKIFVNACQNVFFEQTTKPSKKKKIVKIRIIKLTKDIIMSHGESKNRIRIPFFTCKFLVPVDFCKICIYLGFPKFENIVKKCHI